MSKKAIQDNQVATESLASIMADNLTEFFNGLDWENRIGARDGLLEAYMDVLSYYGDQSALLSTDLYDELRSSFRGLKSFTPQMFSEIDEEKVRANLRYMLTPVFTDGDVAQALDNVNGLAYDHLRLIGDQTLFENANRDPNKARYFRMPEPLACEWCLQQSSRGAVFVSRESAIAGRHDRCRCEAGVTWDKDDVPYDVDKAFAEWKAKVKEREAKKEAKESSPSAD